MADAQSSLPASTDLRSRLRIIEEKLETRRKELGIPGMSLVIVRGDEIIYMKGFGYRDFERRAAVTPDTQFPIASATKPFTALSVLMLQEEGKLSLDDNPNKYLSYFKISDSEIDKNITIRDLLTHSSGLPRTDLAWRTGRLSRQELIQVAGEAKPTARLRQRYQYQNIMYLAAGEIVAEIEKKPWEKFIGDRIFKPLGMTNSSIGSAELQKSKNYSFGYDHNPETRQTVRQPFFNISPIAPAGGINSSARDMAKWLKFVLTGETANGKRLVSEKTFAEWLKPHQKITADGKISYALGWRLEQWNDLKVVQHGGSLVGFDSLVALIPEKKLGFVLLTNVYGSPLGDEAMTIIRENLLATEQTPQTETTAAAPVVSKVNPARELIGKYQTPNGKVTIEIKEADGKISLVFPGRDPYELKEREKDVYRPLPLPDDYAVKVKRNADGKPEIIVLSQPQGELQFKLLAADEKAKELIGKYELEQSKGNFMEIKEVNGRVSLVMKNQPPYPLIEKEKDLYNAQPLPDSFRLKVRRDERGKVSGFTMIQPNGEFAFKYVGEIEAPKFTADEVMAKTIEALGGEASWRKITSRVVKTEIDYENQGIKGYATIYAKAPNLFASETTVTALGKEIATVFEYSDGSRAGEVTSFAPPRTFAGRRFEDIQLENDFYGLLNWKNNLKSVEITGVDKVGGEDVYAVVIRPEKASEYVYHISQKTFLPLRKTSYVVSGTSSQRAPVTSTYSDYRSVDGVMMPFKTVTQSPSAGNILTYIKEVQNNVPIDDNKFRPLNK